MVKVKWTEFAISDLNDIAEYISKDSYQYAALTVEKIFTSTEILETNPQAGRVVPELERINIRELIHGNYRVVYKIINSELIDVLTVHHSKRLIASNSAIQNLEE